MLLLAHAATIKFVVVLVDANRTDSSPRSDGAAWKHNFLSYERHGRRGAHDERKGYFKTTVHEHGYYSVYLRLSLLARILLNSLG